MPDLILGPILRYVDDRCATVWVETDASCEVEILGRHASTFQVCGHHYALVEIEGLRAGEAVEYAVALDGERRWPQEGSGNPPSRIRPIDGDGVLRITFGSCRVAAPHEEPWTRKRVEDEQGRGVDALQALARRLRALPIERWPSLLLMVGDQVYADDASPQTRSFIRSRRSVAQPPGEDVADFEEYAQLYRESWSEPTIRWLLSTVPSAMIFDDHEVIDDWNISEAWRRDMATVSWWPERIAGALMSYWLYQHLGNLSPAELRDDELFARVRSAPEAGPLLHEFALEADRSTDGKRWSYSRRLGGSRLVVIDSRAGRLLRDGRREMVDDEEWAWIERELTGDVDHLLVATSLPYLLPRAIHDLEAWNEAVCAGAWGRAGMWLGERLRRAVDLEHWASFGASFEKLARTLQAVAAGQRGRPPASIVLMSGDVHYAYLAQAHFPGAPTPTRIYQAVCSPFRHGLSRKLELANRAACGRVLEGVGSTLVRLAGVPKPPIRWRVENGPYFENEVATLELQGREAHARLERTPERELRLVGVHEIRLA